MKTRNKVRNVCMTIFIGVMLLVSSTICFASEETTSDDEHGVYTYTSEASSLKGKEHVGGGTWIHWLGVEKLGSEYYHKSKKHSASVKNSNMKKATRTVKKAGSWARASCYATLTGNKAYWNTYK